MKRPTPPHVAAKSRTSIEPFGRERERETKGRHSTRTITGNAPFDGGFVQGGLSGRRDYGRDLFESVSSLHSGPGLSIRKQLNADSKGEVLLAGRNHVACMCVVL